MIEEEADDEVRDAGLISAAQRVEHYEMAGYGCARTYAKLVGDKDGAELPQETFTRSPRRTKNSANSQSTSRPTNSHLPAPAPACARKGPATLVKQPVLIYHRSS
jgi:hypothetical protein